jgi:hypothetical protein
MLLQNLVQSTIICIVLIQDLHGRYEGKVSMYVL